MKKQTLATRATATALGVLWFALPPLLAGPVDDGGATTPRGRVDAAVRGGPDFAGDIVPFLEMHCVRCHGGEVQKARFTVHDIAEDDLERWEKIAEMVSLEDMPPPDEPQPTRDARDAFVGWIEARLSDAGRGESEHRMQLPSYGNRLKHDDLFSGEHTGPAFSYARLWRMSQPIYDELSRRFRASRAPGGQDGGPIDALTALDGEGFEDFAMLPADDAVLRTLMLNYRELVVTMTQGTVVRESNERDRRRAEFRDLALLQEEPPSPDALDAAFGQAVDEAFEVLLLRSPTEGEAGRYGRLLRESVAVSDPLRGFQNMLMAVLMSPEFLFRMELGMGERLEDGRRMLGPRELAYAISFAVSDAPPDRALLEAIAQGHLSTRDDVEREVRRLLFVHDDRRNWDYPMEHRWGEWRADNPRLLRFFQEFFGYTNAEFVFKDHARNHAHRPRHLIRDADLLVLNTLRDDRAVLETLLTTDRYMVAYLPPQLVEGALVRVYTDARRHPDRSNAATLAQGRVPILGRYPGVAVSSYNLDHVTWDYPIDQPFPVANRVGMLTHPAWLIAWSGNFDNDPIRRGKWIREHLLADVVPELPIGVDAKLPEDAHRTLRQRMVVTQEAECWRCHRQMNPLGMAFESYDDFGRHRDDILLGDVQAYRDALHRYDNQMRDRRRDLAKWTAMDAEGRAAYIGECEARIAERDAPDPADPDYEHLQHDYENHVARWSRERDYWAGVTDVRRDEMLAEIARRIDELVAPVPETQPVDASGVLTGTGDPQLDGPYEDVHDLMHRLARSDRVRQSFIRHVFRYWMGRNEMLSDSPTLMAMDRTYVETGGSFKEVLVTLMTSDSFLYRRDKE
ncbi:DUF1588 domain-containing protein [Phycisphaeraceae bacterium D3-23]